ncbi:hypothetical protein, partial [Thiolapillus sp.]
AADIVLQACLRPRDRFWDIPVPKIDSAFDNLFVPQPSWSPSTTQQLRKLVAAPYLAPNDWTPRSEAYFVFPLAQGTPGKQCGLAATGVYQPSLRSPWLAAVEAQGGEHFPLLQEHPRIAGSNGQGLVQHHPVTAVFTAVIGHPAAAAGKCQHQEKGQQDISHLKFPNFLEQ